MNDCTYDIRFHKNRLGDSTASCHTSMWLIAPFFPTGVKLSFWQQNVCDWNTITENSYGKSANNKHGKEKYMLIEINLASWQALISIYSIWTTT